MLYEIGYTKPKMNDPYSFEAERIDLAALAIMSLSAETEAPFHGAAMLNIAPKPDKLDTDLRWRLMKNIHITSADGMTAGPFNPFDRFIKWMKTTTGLDLDQTPDALTVQFGPQLAAIWDTIIIGTIEDRAEFERGLTGCPSELHRIAFRQDWAVAHRRGPSRFDHAAHVTADRMRRCLECGGPHKG